MADERPNFAMQRARPVRGPGIPEEPPKTIVEAPARALRRKPTNASSPPASSGPTPPDLSVIPTRRSAPQNPSNPIHASAPETDSNPAVASVPGHTSNPQVVSEPLQSSNPITTSELAIPLSDVLALTKFPQAIEILNLFHRMDHAGGRLTLHMIHKLWPQLFNR